MLDDPDGVQRYTLIGIVQPGAYFVHAGKGEIAQATIGVDMRNGRKL